MPEPILKLFAPIPKGWDPDYPIHTASSQSCFQRCEMQHHFRYELGFIGIGPYPNLEIGSATHKGLEGYWNGLSYIQAMVHVNEFMNKVDYFSTDAGKIDKIKVATYVKGYFRRWGNSRDDYVVIGVELQFFRPTEEDGRAALAGKLDVLVRRKSDGQLIIIEHKTAGTGTGADDPGSFYWEKLSMDNQLCFYVDQVFELTGEMPEVLYDVVLKTRAKPNKGKASRRKGESDGALQLRKNENAETLSQFATRIDQVYQTEGNKRYIRKPIPILDTELNLKREELEGIRDKIESLLYRRNRNTSACMNFGSVCEYKDVCLGIHSGDKSALLENNLKLKSKKQAHEELEKEKETP